MDQHINDQQMPVQEKKSGDRILAASILIAAVMISGSVLYVSGRGGSAEEPVVPRPQDPPVVAANLDAMRPVSSDDHVRGDPDAPVKIVEYSDTECPFCKRFHDTMQQVMDEYGKDGKVAWVYRHFPLTQIHPKALKESEATECANELGGNEKFWAYMDRLFEVTPSNNQLEVSELPEIAAYVGLDKTKFSACLGSGKYAGHVADDLADAQASGGEGTPWSIVVAANGKKFPLSGAQPYATVKGLIELALKEQ